MYVRGLGGLIWLLVGDYGLVFVDAIVIYNLILRFYSCRVVIYRHPRWVDRSHRHLSLAAGVEIPSLFCPDFPWDFVPRGAHRVGSVSLSCPPPLRSSCARTPVSAAIWV
ncbi:hypothetical protein F4861DRAFT_507620 [Xylaria intraflava]|nr:hypothetical protein F4861DRAFT_507620 [Xylaria intraflava]